MFLWNVIALGWYQMHKLSVFLVFILLTWPTGQDASAFDPNSDSFESGSVASWPSSPLTLEQTIARALANNPEIAARKWDAQAAQARIRAAAGARLPRLALTGSYMHHLDEQRLISAASDGSPGLFGRDILMADLVVSLPLYSGGRLTHQIAATELLHDV